MTNSSTDAAIQAKRTKTIEDDDGVAKEKNSSQTQQEVTTIQSGEAEKYGNVAVLSEATPSIGMEPPPNLPGE